MALCFLFPICLPLRARAPLGTALACGLLSPFATSPYFVDSKGFQFCTAYTAYCYSRE